MSNISKPQTVSQIGSPLQRSHKCFGKRGDPLGSTEETKPNGRSVMSSVCMPKSPPPDYIDLSPVREKQPNGGSSDDSKKRRKLSEQIYEASTVKEDLARGGIPYPKVRLQAPRLLFNISRDIDLSKVQHCVSSDGGTAALTPYRKTVASLATESSREMLSALIAESKSFYCMPPPDAVKTTEAKSGMLLPPYAESSTSSMTESSDDGNANSSSQDDEDVAESSESTDVTAVSPSSAAMEIGKRFISMGQALSITKQPRLIALAFSPFMVVHVNVAFTLLTSQSSTKVLGRPLHELLEDPVVAAALQTSCVRFSLRSLHHQTMKVRNLNSKAGRTSCKVFVSPIGQDLNSNTHYALELQSLEVDGERKTDLNTSLRNEINVEHSVIGRDPSMGVMG